MFFILSIHSKKIHIFTLHICCTGNIDGRCFLEAVLSGRYSIIDAFGMLIAHNHYLWILIYLLMVLIVEDGTMGLHFCKVVPLKDRTVSAEEAVTIAQLQRQGRILAE